MQIAAKAILCVFISCNAYLCFAQPSDFLVLKRKGKTIQTFYAGSNMEFRTVYGAYRNCLVNRIHNDSVFLQEFLIRQIPTTLGTYVYDTAGSFRYEYPYKDISSMGPKPTKGFNVAGSGAALLGGGILLLLANSVVYVADREKFSWQLSAGAAALAGIGYLLSKNSSKGIVIGKRGYTLEYMDMTP